MLSKINRLSILAKQAAAGSLTDAERAEMDALSAKIGAATAPVDLTKVALRLTTMTVKAFQEHAAAVRAAATPDPVDVALLKDNLRAVQDQAPAGLDAVVAVRVKADAAVGRTLEERLAALEAKAAATMVQAGTPPAPPPPAETPAVKAPGAPTATALGMEAMDAIMGRMQQIQAALTAGTLTEQALDEMWPGYKLRHIVETCAEIVGKAETLKATTDAVLPALRKLADGDDTTDAEKGDTAVTDDEVPDAHPPADTQKSAAPHDDPDREAMTARFLAGQPMGKGLTPAEARQRSRMQRVPGTGRIQPRG